MEKSSILYIEDDAEQRTDILARLSEMGYEVTTAATGQEGLERIEAGRFDAVLCDLNMPGIDGFQVLDRARRTTPDLPFIIVTAHGSIALGVEAIKRGAYNFVEKPLQPEYLHVQLMHAVDHGRTQRRLRQSEMLLEMLLETVPDVIYSLDPQGRFLSISPSSERVLGYRPGDMLGRSVFELIHPDDAARVRNSLEQSFDHRDDQIRTIEFRMINASGEARDFEIKRRLIFDEQGNVIRNDGIARDVTDRGRAAAELQAILDTSNNAIIMTRPDGTITASNRSLCDFFDISPEWAIGRPLDELTDRIAACFEDEGRFREEIRRLEQAPDQRELEGLDHHELYRRQLQMVHTARRHVALFCFRVETDGRDIGRVWTFTDFTKFKEADEQLHKLVQVSPIPLIITRVQDGRILFANEHLADLVGHSVSELVGQVSPDFYADPGDRHRVLELLESNGRVRDHEVRLRHRDGHTFWAMFSLVLTEMAGETVILGGVYDIDTRKAIEDALRWERNFVSAILDTAGALVVVLDSQGRIVRFNEACRLTTGYTFEEVRDRPFWDIFLLPDEAAAVRRVFGSLTQGNFPSFHENHWMTRSGERRFISWANTALTDAAGNAEYIVATGIDITDQRRAEQAIENRLRHEEALAACSRILLTADDTQDPMDRVLPHLQRASRAGRVYIFFNKETDQGLCCRQSHELCAEGVEPQIDNPALQCLPYREGFSRWAEILGRGEPIQGPVPSLPEQERDLLQAQGIRSILVLPIRIGTRWVGFIGFDDVEADREWSDEDIRALRTAAEMIGVYLRRREAQQDLERAHQELKDKQAQLVQSEKMASLGMLVAGIAHEINTPIGAVNSVHNTLVRSAEKLNQILAQEAPDLLESNRKLGRALRAIDESNQVIRSGTERVTTIVRRLKSFARLDEAQLKRVDIHEGIEDTLTIIHHELKHKVQVERHFGQVPPLPCYPSQLNQVFLNVFINAKQAIPDTGTITVTTRVESGRAVIDIADDGIGMSRETMERIFDPGFTTKGVGVGTGLGLAICFQIVQDHHGEISVQSEPGKGTTFTVTLPMDLDRILGVSL